MKHKVLGILILVSIITSFGFSKSKRDEISIQISDDRTYLNTGDQCEMKVIRSGIYENGEIKVYGSGCSLSKSGLKYIVTISAKSKATSARIIVSWHKQKKDKYITVCDKTIEIRYFD